MEVILQQAQNTYDTNSDNRPSMSRFNKKVTDIRIAKERIRTLQAIIIAKACSGWKH